MEKCIHGLDGGNTKCVFCNGDWDAQVVEYIKGLGKTEQQLENAEARIPTSCREYDFFVPAEWKFIMSETNNIQADDFDGLTDVAICIGRSFLHVLWLYINIWPERFTSECKKYVSVTF